VKLIGIVLHGSVGIFQFAFSKAWQVWGNDAELRRKVGGEIFPYLFAFAKTVYKHKRRSLSLVPAT
jgi:hypothetical protein